MFELITMASYIKQMRLAGEKAREGKTLQASSETVLADLSVI
jgi:hypothetical protein